MAYGKQTGQRKTAASKKRTLLKNGLIVDGTGSKGFTGDVLINGEVIEKISRTPIEFNGNTLNCTGMVISPGFIDVHSHMDGLLAFPGLESTKVSFTAQGCTTFVAGNCGMSAGCIRKGNGYQDNLTFEGQSMEVPWSDMAGYFRHLETIGLTHNLIDLAGNGSTRISFRGNSAEPLNQHELEEMLVRLEQSMDQGAAGVSFGLQYVPDLFCTNDEILAVACLVKKKDKIITVHGRAYSFSSQAYPTDTSGTSHSVLSLREMINIARETGVRLQYSHLMFAGTRSHSSYRPCLEEIDKARAEGIDVMTDTYPYHCGTSVINVILPRWFQANFKEAIQDEKMLADVERGLMRLEEGAGVGFGFHHLQLSYADSPEFQPYHGKFINEIAKEMGISSAKVVLKLSKATNGRASMLLHNYSNMEVIDALIKHPNCLFMTDAVPRKDGFQNPAAFGSFPLLLQYARDRNLISIEEAIRKMTGASAVRLQIKDRGFLKEGLAADITVFNWDKIKDNNTVTKTDCAPTGIKAVFINGHQVVSDGKVDSSIKAGKVIRV